MCWYPNEMHTEYTPSQNAGQRLARVRLGRSPPPIVRANRATAPATNRTTVSRYASRSPLATTYRVTSEFAANEISTKVRSTAVCCGRVVGTVVSMPEPIVAATAVGPAGCGASGSQRAIDAVPAGVVRATGDRRWSWVAFG